MDVPNHSAPFYLPRVPHVHKKCPEASSPTSTPFYLLQHLSIFFLRETFLSKTKSVQKLPSLPLQPRSRRSLPLQPPTRHSFTFLSSSTSFYLLLKRNFSLQNKKRVQKLPSLPLQPRSRCSLPLQPPTHHSFPLAACTVLSHHGLHRHWSSCVWRQHLQAWLHLHRATFVGLRSLHHPSGHLVDNSIMAKTIGEQFVPVCYCTWSSPPLRTNDSWERH
ncbi:uncharacterized protein [Glycine max]|uniref:uncharacterized protein isoform X1 n=1 Tax=Glycine max TaxID=3847 RepID=UPI0003DE8ABB|nr:uncharacterized protein LOC102668215 isoform X1 [Glycine max]|eukprot:XP_006585814.1 uncharacterized protein LOC102668215 [Glycine max]